jgi:SAM-dependent methyltransferase
MLVRAASHLPYIRGFRAKLIEERNEWARQRQLLETERDELAGHCKRLNEELAAAQAHEERLRADCERLLEQRDALEQERNQLFEYCRQLNPEAANTATPQISPTQYLLQKMRQDWDDRARVNAAYYTNSANPAWDDAEYFATGEVNVREEILTDMGNICQGSDPKTMRMLEIGCGAGRVTKALSRIFGEVHAVDISAEMIQRAQANLNGVPNVFFYQNNGMDLNVVPDLEFDFVFSFIVFQHIPSKEVIESYVREAHRLLKPGKLFKFQLQGGSPHGQEPFDTWLGADFSEEEVRAMAARCGFEARYLHGAGTQYFWVWFFRV